MHGDSSGFWLGRANARLTRRRLLRGSAALSAAGALGLAGCSSGNNNGAGKAAPSASAAVAPTGAVSPAAAGVSAATAAATRAAPPARTATPAAGAQAQQAPGANSALKTGGTINASFVVANVPLDPFANTTYTTQYLAGFAYSRLFRFLAGPDPNTSLSRLPVPDLVQSYQLVDPTTYVMKLRQNAMFHPPLNRPATSADVQASFQRFSSETRNTNAQIFAPIIDSITTPDAATLQFKLKQPYAPFLNKLANPQYLWILSQESTAGKIDPTQQMIGTGPWIWSGATATAYSYKKNPSYFLAGLPYADSVALNVIPMTANQESQFTGGALDLLGIPAADVDAIKKALPKAGVTQYVGNLLAYLFFSDVTKDSIFKDERVRQAASLAIDRPGLLQVLYSGQGAWDNLINPGLGRWWLDPQSSQAGDSGKLFKQDLQAAKQLLSAAGYTGQPIGYYYPNDAYGDLFNQAADTVRGMLADGGFKLNVVTVSYLKDWIEPTHGYAFKGVPPNSMAYALETPFTEPDDYLSSMLVAGGSRNNSFVNDAQLEALVKAQQVQLDDAMRLQQVYQVQQMQAAKMYYVPSVNGKTFLFNQPWTQNLWVSDDYGFGTEQYAYLSVNNK